jgi:MFS family permease
MQKNVTYGQILSIKRALFCLVTVVFALFFSVEPFLSKALQDIGFDKNLVGYIFGFFAFMYTLMAFMVGPLTKRFTSRVVSFFSYIIIATGCALFGPSSLIKSEDYTCTAAKCGEFYTDPSGCEAYYKERRIFTILGLLVLGTGSGSVVVPILVELVTAIKEKMGAVSKQANDKASGLFTMCSALGTILGQIIGGRLYASIGVIRTMDIYVGLSLFMALIFFAMNIWPGFLLTPKLDQPEGEASQNQQLINGTKAGGASQVHMSRAVRDALEEKAVDSRMVLSIRGSIAGDLIFPVTNEQKIYLADIDEDDDSENEISRKY